ncbi:MAG TPA: cyclic nucleotide-binding domain-containing protein [Usitatibacter sp.]|nr:cyclic nucleotide-binding domain-containing protein [Usitatibacter sp.]
MDVKLEMFRNESESVSFEAGQPIFHEGDSGDAMYVILEGEVEISIGGELVETLAAGQPFGEMALVDQSPRLVTAIAKMPTVLASVPLKRFLYMVEETPYFSVQIMKVMAERLRTLNSWRMSHVSAR